MLVNQFTIKMGFNLLIPYLAGHLSQGLGMAAWALGLVLGVRNVSQRGMCLVGGYLTDRLGCRTAVVAGCALRTGGFALLGFATDLPALVVAAAATGFAGALFDPGVRVLLSNAAGERRVEAFALFNVAGQAGLLIGPLLGLALSGLNFPAVAMTAAGVFAVLTVLQAVALPRTADAAVEALRGWGPLLRDKPFICFSVAMAGSYILSFQVYLALPLVMGHALGPEQNIGMGEMFAMSAVLVILFQSRVATWARRRWSAVQSMVRGLVVMALAFAPLVVISAPTPPIMASEELAEHVAILPMLAAAALLALGSMLICPFEMDVIVRLSGGHLVATHYGLYATVSGVAITVGSLVTGTIWDAAARAGLTWLPWAGLALVGACCALAVMLLDRMNLLAGAGPGGGRGKKVRVTITRD
ncbi:MAG: hypothetical protein JWQ95_4857 [Sphaerisporangium sp.]|jgi:MFS family permease|nr:hypothetical protein [Sphaerisporangium sp.]